MCQSTTGTHLTAHCIVALSQAHNHNRTGSLLAMILTMLSFLYCSFSDPGVVNPTTHHLYDNNYPYDNLIFSEKKCKTCKITK